MNGENQGKKMDATGEKLGKFDVFMILVCGIMFADIIASNTGTGIPSVTWWVILGVLYMIPSGFIIGELSGVYPEQGGIFVWIREGMGITWAARSSWLFFCCGFFIPVSSFIMCSDILFDMFYPAASYVLRVAVAIVLLWIMVYVASKPMSESKGIVNAAGIIKLSIFVLSFAAGIVYLAKGNAIANDISLSTLTPSLDQGLMYLPIILYCMTGMELASASAEDTKDPSKTLPKIVGGVAIMAVLLNVLASLGTLMVIPLNELDIVTGTTDLFIKAFGSPIFYYIIGIAFVFSIFAQCATWAIGGARGTAESAKAGEFPAILGKETKAGLPVGAMVITTIIGTVLLIVYAFMANSAADLFYNLLSCGVLGSLLPYVFMLISYQRLKKGAMKKHGGFKAPLGVASSWIAQIIQIVTLGLLIYIPGQGWNPSVVTTILGAAIMLISGEIIIKWQKSKQN